MRPLNPETSAPRTSQCSDAVKCPGRLSRQHPGEVRWCQSECADETVGELITKTLVTRESKERRYIPQYTLKQMVQESIKSGSSVHDHRATSFGTI